MAVNSIHFKIVFVLRLPTNPLPFQLISACNINLRSDLVESRSALISYRHFRMLLKHYSEQVLPCSGKLVTRMHTNKQAPQSKRAVKNLFSYYIFVRKSITRLTRPCVRNYDSIACEKAIMSRS